MLDGEEYQVFINAGGHGDGGCLEVMWHSTQAAAEKILSLA